MLNNVKGSVRTTVDGFFHRHPVFTLQEFTAYIRSGKSVNKRTIESLLRYYVRSGRLFRIRRGIYGVVPQGFSLETAPIDPYLIASKMSKDAVLGYHTALQFHGIAYSSSHRYLYLTRHAIRLTQFRGYVFHSVRTPKKLLKIKKEFFAVETHERQGIPVRVTSLERTMVDIFDRPHLGGGWEEIWRSLEMVEFFDLDTVVEYALLLGNATTIAKVGFFLEQHREKLMVEEHHLKTLRAHRPRNPHYMVRTPRKSGRLIPEWNLVVPEDILERRWEEVS